MSGWAKDNIKTESTKEAPPTKAKASGIWAAVDSAEKCVEEMTSVLSQILRVQAIEQYKILSTREMLEVVQLFNTDDFNFKGNDQDLKVYALTSGLRIKSIKLQEAKNELL